MEPLSFQDSKRQNRDMLMRRTIRKYKLGSRENKKGRLSTYFPIIQDSRISKSKQK